MDRTHENFHSVLNMVSWTTKLKGNHLNNLSCIVQLPCHVLCHIVLKQYNFLYIMQMTQTTNFVVVRTFGARELASLPFDH